ncbi:MULTISPECIES: hypothetical protein [Stenotrophomonas]|uniref:hypothetical protein n=1 Tax=Stenotrophomonas TaxID=40323 RepID=UPI00258C5884|nr:MULTISPECIES: hypothetical protein [Stenotrophomonas]MCR1005756.1 hypothetical protein [Stenotrophomonas maltophilia]MCR1570563.1 hypothetical protein [Stenotrophomonas sp.]
MSRFVAADGRAMMRCDQSACTVSVAVSNAGTLGWDWFTGWLPDTRHFCKKHASSEQRNAEFARSREAPAHG